MRRFGTIGPVAAVGLLLAVAAVAAAFSAPQWGTVQRPATDVGPRIEPDLDDRDGLVLPSAGVEVDSPGWLLPVLLAIVAAVLLGLLAVVVRTLVSRTARLRLRPLADARLPRVASGQPDQEQLLAAVDAGLADLSQDDRDPRRAVIGCWLRLAEAAAAAGTPRHPADTATDLVVRLLRSQQVGESALAELTQVYQLARYATHTVDEGMRQQAQAALHRLSDELTAGVSTR